MTAPGWHHAEGDPPGTVRYWDGELWQGNFQYQTPPPGPGQYQPGIYQHGGYPGGAAYPQYRESSQATAALVLGILGLVLCGLCGPFAWHIGNKEVRGIDAGLRDPSNRGTAQAGRIMGMIVTILMLLGALFVLAVLGFGVGA